MGDKKLKKVDGVRETTEKVRVIKIIGPKMLIIGSKIWNFLLGTMYS